MQSCVAIEEQAKRERPPGVRKCLHCTVRPHHEVALLHHVRVVVDPLPHGVESLYVADERLETVIFVEPLPDPSTASVDMSGEDMLLKATSLTLFSAEPLTGHCEIQSEEIESR